MITAAFLLIGFGVLFYWVFIAPARAEKERRRRQPGPSWQGQPWDSGRRGPR
ncbi:MAG TPA: hypothetical protein VFB08_00340 [Burkholderiales bacterium]|nr:hypothetical protein [Burkholderiales bacterium]